MPNTPLRKLTRMNISLVKGLNPYKSLFGVERTYPKTVSVMVQVENDPKCGLSKKCAED